MSIRGDVRATIIRNIRQLHVTNESGEHVYDLKTSFAYPPIPVRCMDWQAWLDGCEENGPYGTGSTEEAAVADLMEVIQS